MTCAAVPNLPGMAIAPSTTVSISSSRPSATSARASLARIQIRSG